MTIKRRISPAKLAAWGKRLNLAISPLSPFKLWPDEAAEVEESEATLQPVLQELAKTKGFVQLRFTNSPELFNHTVYFSEQNEGGVALTSLGKELLLEAPAPVQELLDSLGRNMGKSSLIGHSFHCQVSPLAGVLFCALLDEQRRQYWSAMSNDAAAASICCELNDLVSAKPQMPQSLALLMADTAELSWPLDSAASELAASELVQKGLLLFKDGAYSLGEGALRLAGRFLALESILHVNAGYVPDDEILVTSGVSYVQAGVRDILCLEATEREATISTVSAQSVISHMQQALSGAAGNQEMSGEDKS